MYFRIFTLIWMLCASGYSGAQIQQEIPFEWTNDSLNGEYFPKTVMHIPVQFPGDTATYYFQFDTGANKSSIYSSNPSQRTLFEPPSGSEPVATSIGELEFIAIQSNMIYTERGKTHVGTIGADFLKDKIIEIDFVHEKIRILASYNPMDYHLHPIELYYGRPVLSLKINQKPFSFLFDTGSSLFELLTTKKNWKKWRNPASQIKSFPIQAWGETHLAYRTKLKNPANLNGCSTLTFTSVWYNSNKANKQFFKQGKIDGIIGNKPFTNETILIDVQQQRFGLKKCP